MRPGGTDPVQVTPTTHRYEATDGQGVTDGRFPRPTHHPSEDQSNMTPRTGTVEQIRSEIDEQQYQVNAGAVADAILRRLLDGRSLK
jgi:anti-sigma28 factor (negative regulator of flagellin synthesis)